jgi:uncharacterized protein (DUF4213/DUF364 family)
MSFANGYLQQLQTFAAASPLPRIRALHLPPQQELDNNRGEFCALELEDGSLGQSYVLFDDSLQHLRADAGHLNLQGADALELARHYTSDNGAWRTLGFAAANALTRCLMDRAGFRPDQSRDSIGQIQPQSGEHIGMIGFFKPLLGAIVQSGARLTVLELDPSLVTETARYRVTLNPAELADCSKVLSTSTLLLNNSLDRMLATCRRARWFAMVGPSAGCLPDGLFARGVTLQGGSWITDSAGFVDALRAGESRSRFSVKFALTVDNYPGFEPLLLRL